MKYALLCSCMLLATTGNAQEKLPDTAGKPKVFMYVEGAPSCPYNVGDYLYENLRYPKEAAAHNIEGRVIVKFIVNEDGHISDATIVKGVHELLDAEALRVVSKMPPWKPGKQNGKEVKVFFNLPIVFKLEDPAPAKEQHATETR